MSFIIQFKQHEGRKDHAHNGEEHMHTEASHHHHDTLKAPSKASTAPKPHRKKRADAGKPQGPKKPHTPSKTIALDNGTTKVSLQGRYGNGKHLLVSSQDLPDLLSFSDNGTRLHVVNNGTGRPYVSIHGHKAQAWKHSSNPRDLLTVARYLVGETHRGRRITFKDHNPFNLTRDNLEVLVPAIEQTFTIDWEKAEAARHAKAAEASKAAQAQGKAL